MTIFRKPKTQAGQSLVEYVALTALVAILSISTVKIFGNRVKSRLHQITNAFDRNVQQGLKGHVVESEDDNSSNHL